MMYYIDIIKRLYPYELMSMSRKESYEFFRNRLLEHYMPGHNGQSMSDAQAIEAAGQVLNEMSVLHKDRSEKINPDFEIHIYAEWLKANRQQFWYSDVNGLARTIANGVYEWCRNHNTCGLALSPLFISIISELPMHYK